MLIFEKSKKNRVAESQILETVNVKLPKRFLRQKKARLPECSELDVVRHYTQLSQLNFSIDTHFYPLGSCTMKYNPRAAHRLALLPGFASGHPLTMPENSQGFMACVHELQEILKAITGMEAVTLATMAGAQGEFAGVSMIRAYHDARGDSARTEMIVPDAAHGTNPASAVICGYKVIEVPTTAEGDVDLEKLRKLVGPQTAGIMLTNPSTLGVFERQIGEISKLMHECGGLMYYDGANLNAIMGKVRPADMGFDVMHINLHKTFATPHGGGGPGAGPVAAGARLAKYLPIPMVRHDSREYFWQQESDCPESIGRVATFMGNAGIILRAYCYARLLGREGLPRVAEFASLNANYLAKRLANADMSLAFPTRRASHEFIITYRKEAKKYSVSAMDIAKRLLDYGYHAPTTYFPLLIPECFLIEPTETESKQTLDAFADALIAIMQEIIDHPDLVKNAPHTLPVRRLDDVRAVKELDLNWYAKQGESA
jgi:glycine dehydrogenase subunit 2